MTERVEEVQLVAGMQCASKCVRFVQLTDFYCRETSLKRPWLALAASLVADNYKPSLPRCLHPGGG
jgi:hypothetical protein